MTSLINQVSIRSTNQWFIYQSLNQPPKWFPKQCLHWRGSYGVAKDGVMACLATRPRYTAAHFCCYWQYFVHVASLPCRRNTLSRHLRQKNIYVCYNFLQILFWASFGPDASQMSPRCRPDASQMPLRCFLDASRCFPDASRCFPKTVWGLALG